MNQEASGFVDLLRDRTKSLHNTAERSGFVRDILTGRASRYGYALFLRNILPAYHAMEIGLARNRSKAWIRAIARPEIYRTEAMVSDLHALIGSAWSGSLPLLPAAERYAQRIELAANGDAARLIAHAYTRYLGDLNGGQALRTVLSRSLCLEPPMLSFYDFSQISDLRAFADDYRAAIDRAGLEVGNASIIIEEAATAFQLNIDVSNAVKDTISAR